MTETAVFGGGCFWCTEAVFQMLKGVESVESGYAGGVSENPTYESVSLGNTGHAEVIKVVYDPEAISYHDLLTVFFGSHDATQVNRQGNDVGEQYRSIILTTTDAQAAEANHFIETLNASSTEGDSIKTEVKPLETFYKGEAYHQDYYKQNQNKGYCQIVIAPKLEKVQKEYAELLKKHS